MLPNPEDTYLVVLPVKIPHYFTFKIIMEKNKDSWRKKKKMHHPGKHCVFPVSPVWDWKPDTSLPLHICESHTGNMDLQHLTQIAKIKPFTKCTLAPCFHIKSE